MDKENLQRVFVYCCRLAGRALLHSSWQSSSQVMEHSITAHLHKILNSKQVSEIQKDFGKKEGPPLYQKWKIKSPKLAQL